MVPAGTFFEYLSELLELTVKANHIWMVRVSVHRRRRRRRRERDSQNSPFIHNNLFPNFPTNSVTRYKKD
jgi:hypothetical protein